jgi:hypothetical protein
LLGLFFDPEDGGTYCFETSLAFNELHDLISQKIELFSMKVIEVDLFRLTAV